MAYEPLMEFVQKYRAAREEAKFEDCEECKKLQAFCSEECEDAWNEGK